jgi:hypothetical protein
MRSLGTVTHEVNAQELRCVAQVYEVRCRIIVPVPKSRTYTTGVEVGFIDILAPTLMCYFVKRGPHAACSRVDGEVCFV